MYNNELTMPSIVAIIIVILILIHYIAALFVYVEEWETALEL